MRIVILLILCCLGKAFSQSKAKSNDQTKPLFAIGHSVVTTNEFVYLFKKNHLNKPEDFTTTKVQEYLQLYINFKLKVAEALAKGIDTTITFKKEFDQYREEIKKPFVSEGDDLDRLVKEAYHRSIEQVRASHILIMVKEDASPSDTLIAWNKIDDLRKKAVAGSDFAGLAKDFSEDPSAKSNGGDLGYFSAFDMVYPFESAAYNTRVGEISPIIKTRFGYHIIKVFDHRPSQGEVEVSHIMLRTEKDDPKIRNSIFEISDQLKAGRPWDELCKEFSEDPNTKMNGGRLRPFGMGTFTTAAPDFEKTAFSMQNAGDISDPIQTPFGWHIIRLEKKIPVPTFKEAQANLSRKISRDERLQLSKDARLEKVRTQFQFTENEASKNWVFALADSSLQKAKWVYSNEDKSSATTLCTVAGKTYPVMEFLNYAVEHQIVNNLPPAAYLEQLYDKWTARILNLAEEEKLINEKPEFKSMLEEYREGILLFTIMEQEVWNKASNDSLGQQKFYQGHEGLYQAGDRVKARILSTDSENILDEIKSKIAFGDTLTTNDLRKLKSVSSFRTFEKGESKVIDSIPWTVGSHETKMDGIFYLVDVIQLVPPGIKSFEDARANIISDYQDLLEKEWLIALKKKYPVSINAKGKKAVIKELTAK